MDRLICVLPAISKIISKVILDRIKDHLYSTIDREQAGFRPGSSCIDHINTLIIEQSAEYRSDLHLIFVAFEKAFDSVDREVLWMALSRRRIPNKIVSVIKSTYNDAVCCTMVPFQHLLLLAVELDKATYYHLCCFY